MTYIENVFVCIVAPLLVATVFVGKHYYRYFLFCIAGMTMCLLSAYINTFFTLLYDAPLLIATAEIAPVVEEVMKFLPLLFYLSVFEPQREHIRTAVILISTGFATFENICYLTQHGAAELPFLLIRGFGTGAMHIVCGAIVGFGLMHIWRRDPIKIAGAFGLLCAAITYHAIYNLLLFGHGAVQMIAYILPILTLAISVGFSRLQKAKILK